MKIDIFGTYPPPVGGTSIHIQRLADFCSRNSINVRVFDTMGRVRNSENEPEYVSHITNYKKFLKYYWNDKSADIIHSHSHSWVERAVLTFKAKSKGQKVIFTFHSFRDDKARLSLKQNWAYKYVFRHADCFVATNPNIKEKLVDWGCDDSIIRVISPFIRPSKTDYNKLDQEIQEFRNRFDFIICANASHNNHLNSVDLYGLDMCVRLQARLVKEYNCGFVFVLTNVTDNDYLTEIGKMIDDNKISDSFLIIKRPIDFISVIKESKVFVRPTCTDSRPISVDESVCLGVPVIASDVCPHPKSCISFEARNDESFYEKVKYVLNNYSCVMDEVNRDIIHDASESIFLLYQSLLKDYTDA